MCVIIPMYVCVYIYIYLIYYSFSEYHQFDLTPSNPHPSPLVLGYELLKFRFARSDCFAVVGLQLQAGNQGQQRESGQAGNLRRQRHAGKGVREGKLTGHPPDKPPIFRAFWVKTAQLPVDSIGCHRSPVELNGWNLGPQNIERSRNSRNSLDSFDAFYAHHAGIWIPPFTQFLWPSFVGKYTSTMEHMGLMQKLYI